MYYFYYIFLNLHALTLKCNKLTNITLVQVELGLDPLSYVLGSRFIDKKNVIEKKNPTKNSQQNSSMEISHQLRR